MDRWKNRKEWWKGWEETKRKKKTNIKSSFMTAVTSSIVNRKIYWMNECVNWMRKKKEKDRVKNI